MLNFKDKHGSIYYCDFKFKNINALVLSGGALKCIYFLGALSKIPTLKNIKYYCGTSCGALVSILLAVGYTPLEIFKQIFREEVNIKTIHFALDHALNIIKDMLIAKGVDQHISFENFFKQTNKEVAFISCNVSKLREEILCRQTYPNLSVMEAAKMSCSLPIIFPAAKFNNDIYIDGIFFDNFPVKLLNFYKDVKDAVCITTLHSHYDKRIQEMYKNKNYKFLMIPETIKKYFCLTKKDKFYMFVIGYNYVDVNISKCKALEKKNRRKSIS